MLAIMLTLNTFSQKKSFQKAEAKIAFSNYSSEKNQHPTLISSEFDDKNLVYNETEKSESEIELDFFHDYSFQDNFLETNFKSGINSNTFNFHKSTQKLPLYDLFCNWKLHLI